VNPISLSKKCLFLGDDKQEMMNPISYSSVVIEPLLAIKSSQAASLFEASVATGSNRRSYNVPIPGSRNLQLHNWHSSSVIIAIKLFAIQCSWPIRHDRRADISIGLLGPVHST
jgi:hypothetical protein